MQCIVKLMNWPKDLPLTHSVAESFGSRIMRGRLHVPGEARSARTLYALHNEVSPLYLECVRTFQDAVREPSVSEYRAGTAVRACTLLASEPDVLREMSNRRYIPRSVLRRKALACTRHVVCLTLVRFYADALTLTLLLVSMLNRKLSSVCDVATLSTLDRQVHVCIYCIGLHDIIPSTRRNYESTYHRHRASSHSLLPEKSEHNAYR